MKKAFHELHDRDLLEYLGDSGIVFDRVSNTHDVVFYRDGKRTGEPLRHEDVRRIIEERNKKKS